MSSPTIRMWYRITSYLQVHWWVLEWVTLTFESAMEHIGIFTRAVQRWCFTTPFLKLESQVLFKAQETGNTIPGGRGHSVGWAGQWLQKDMAHRLMETSAASRTALGGPHSFRDMSYSRSWTFWHPLILRSEVMYLLITLLIAQDYHPGGLDDIFRWVELQITYFGLNPIKRKLSGRKVESPSRDKPNGSNPVNWEIWSKKLPPIPSAFWAKRGFVLFIHFSRQMDYIMITITIVFYFLLNKIKYN